ARRRHRPRPRLRAVPRRGARHRVGRGPGRRRRRRRRVVAGAGVAPRPRGRRRAACPPRGAWRPGGGPCHRARGAGVGDRSRRAVRRRRRVDARVARRAHPCAHRRLRGGLGVRAGAGRRARRPRHGGAVGASCRRSAPGGRVRPGALRGQPDPDLERRAAALGTSSGRRLCGTGPRRGGLGTLAAPLARRAGRALCARGDGPLSPPPGRLDRGRRAPGARATRAPCRSRGPRLPGRARGSRGTGPRRARRRPRAGRRSPRCAGRLGAGGGAPPAERARAGEARGARGGGWRTLAGPRRPVPM
ncbi:MAG: hypothetical protein AVDCRST_MAG53-1728, partial [uncultured Solirubrobacteraceae bacterium]